MKLINKILLLSIFTIATIVSCKDSNENLVGDRGKYSVPGFSNLSPSYLNYKDITNASISFTVSLNGGSSIPDYGILMMTATDTVSKTVEVKKITSFPANITLKSSDIAATLGISVSDILKGTIYDFYILTVKDGDTAVYSTDTHLSVEVMCAFDESLTSGSYYEESTGWEVKGNVTITTTESDPYTIYISGMQANEGLTNCTSNKVKLVIDPETFELSGGSTLFAANLADFGTSYASKTNYTFKFKSGTYNSCDGSLDVIFSINIDQGTYGSYEFTFNRN